MISRSFILKTSLTQDELLNRDFFKLVSSIRKYKNGNLAQTSSDSPLLSSSVKLVWIDELNPILHGVILSFNYAEVENQLLLWSFKPNLACVLAYV